jgi:hypothetical protein
VWRLIELKRAIWRLTEDDPSLSTLQQRLRELESLEDPIDRLLAEVEALANGHELGSPANENQLELFGRALDDTVDTDIHQVRQRDGVAYRGTWFDILTQMRERAGFSHETLFDFMRRMAERWHEQWGLEIPFNDPEVFLRAAILAGILKQEA